MTSLVLYVIISLLIGHTLTGLFQKEIKHAGGSGGGRERGSWRKNFFEKPLGFLYFTTWEVSGKTKLYPCVRHLENPKAKYQNIYPWKFHINFLVTPAGNLAFLMPFFQYTWIGISISLAPPSLVWVFTEIAH